MKIRSPRPPGLGLCEPAYNGGAIESRNVLCRPASRRGARREDSRHRRGPPLHLRGDCRAGEWRQRATPRWCGAGRPRFDYPTGFARVRSHIFRRHEDRRSGRPDQHGAAGGGLHVPDRRQPGEGCRERGFAARHRPRIAGDRVRCYFGGRYRVLAVDLRQHRTAQGSRPSACGLDHGLRRFCARCARHLCG